MFARNLGLSCFFSLKITNFLKQTFLKDLKKIKVNYQKVPVPSTGTAVLFKNSTGTDGTFFKQVPVVVPRYFKKVPCPPLQAALPS